MLGRRFRYTAKDYDALTAELERFLPEFVPEISDSTRRNPGRLFLQAWVALFDVLGYQQDINFIESLWGMAQQERNLVLMAQGIPWAYPGPSPASVDLEFTSVGGPTLNVPPYLACTTADNPPKKYLTVASGSVAAPGETVTVAAVEGERVIEEVLTESASGEVNQTYELENAYTPYQYIEVRVGTTLWERQAFTLFDSESDAEHYVVRPNPADLSKARIVFGDNEWGAAPPAGSRITVSYIRCNGSDGNTPANSITKITGPISASFNVNNPEAGAGGSYGPDADTIRMQAPWLGQTYQRAVNEEDFLAIAVNVPGVYDAAIANIIGSIFNLYVMPEGGGVASQALLDLVKNTIQPLQVIGGVVNVETVEPIELRITARVFTRTNDLPRSVIRQKVIDEILANLVYTEIEIGKAFTVSELSRIILDIEDSSLIQSVNFPILTAVPRVVQSVESDPAMQGDIEVLAGAGYSEWTVTELTPTTFTVKRDGSTVDTGTVGEQFTSPDNEIRFTLGTPTDTLTAGAVWSFRTSKYSGNIQIGSGEVPVISSLSNVEVEVYYPEDDTTPFS